MSKQIFVVDDERIIADTLTAILNASGYHARAFYDGESALLACGDGRPDCIISDVVMPKLNGVDLALEVRRRFPACQILLFSGQAATREILDSAHRQGYQFDLILKPIHPTDLLARLQRSDYPALSEAAAMQT